MPPDAEARKTFSEVQYGFARHLRDPSRYPAPAGIEDRRLAIYRDLLFKNVEGFMANTYPVLRKVLGPEPWRTLVRDYFREHEARTPLFPKMPQEFLQYLETEREPQPGDPPFMNELAHYEWLELSLAIDSREIDGSGVDAHGDLLAETPVLSPLVRTVAYAWPVHRIGPDFTPDAPPAQPTYLLVYRDRHDKVGFMELNAVSARLVELLGGGTDATGRALLEEIAAELRHPNPAVVVEGGLGILESMQDRDIVIGTRA